MPIKTNINYSKYIFWSSVLFIWIISTLTDRIWWNLYSNTPSWDQADYLCNGNDLNAIYDTLLKTLSNGHYLELGANALEFSKEFSWNKIIKKYISLI